ncbi:Cytochrome P450 [Corchorus olitorius]|uniref:Cytochrome P450 n=1 Tax=Corchorus olitorius TaxID=93759 RepID=A0A1R3L4W8_9ROSI|nr:Cytochrome P450 [Corchorus olitorius]
MELLKKHFQEFILGLMSLPAKKRMVKIIHKIIQSKRNSGISSSSTVPKDVADVLLNDASELFTDDLIADNIIDFMIPGEDSVPILITLAIKYLSDCPAALHQFDGGKHEAEKAQSSEWGATDLE